MSPEVPDLFEMLARSHRAASGNCETVVLGGAANPVFSLHDLCKLPRRPRVGGGFFGLTGGDSFISTVDETGSLPSTTITKI